MNSSFDYRKAIEGAKDFKGILAAFVALNFVTGEHFFDVHVRKIAATRKIKEAIEIVESGTDDVEARYFALSQINGPLAWQADFPMGERNAITKKYADAFREARTELFNSYSNKGTEALKALGVHDDFAEHARLEAEREVMGAKLEAALEEIESEYFPKTAAANREYVFPILDKIAEIDKRFNLEREDLYSHRPDMTKSQEYELWFKELGDQQRRYEHERNEQIDESTKAIRTYVQPLEDEKYEKKRLKASEYGRLDELSVKRTELTKNIHAKVIIHLLETSPVTQEDAQAWIDQNAIMNKSAITKAKKAGYDPKEAMKDLVEFYRITGGRIPRLAYVTTRNQRSQASPHAGNLYVGSRFGKKTFFHELAHLLESDRKIAAAAQVFLEKRRESTTLYSLRSLTGINYKKDERAFKDNFINPYVGKYYRDEITEVFSMGMQHLASPEALMELQQKDPEHLALMLGVCLSKPRVDEDQKKAMQSEVQKKKAAAKKTDDVLKDLDKKISKAGKFWEGHATIENAYKNRRGQTVHSVISLDRKSLGSFTSEKSMKRALYLWITKGKPDVGEFALHNLRYSVSGKGFLAETLIDALAREPLSEISNA